MLKFNDIEIAPSRWAGRKFLVISDSYGTGVHPDGNITPWVTYLKKRLGVSDDNYITSCLGGSAFYASSSSNTTFETLLSQVTDDLDITDIIVGGGYNDRKNSLADIKTAVSSFKTYAATHFPNAKIKVAFIGNTSNPDTRYSVCRCISRYMDACRSNDIEFLAGCEYAIRNYDACISSDGIHPTTEGQIKIAEYVYNALVGNGNGCNIEFLGVTLTAAGSVTSITNNNAVGANINNGALQFSSQKAIVFDLNSLSIGSANNENYVTLATVSGLIVGNEYRMNNISITALVLNNAKWYNVPGYLCVMSGELRFYPYAVVDEESFMTLDKVTQIRIPPFSAVFDCLMC